MQHSCDFLTDIAQHTFFALQVAFVINFTCNSSGQFQATLGEQVFRQADPASVAFHHPQRGARHAVIEVWSHGHYHNAVQTVINKLVAQQMHQPAAWTADDQRVLDICNQAVALEVAQDWLTWTKFVREHHQDLPNDYCGPCIMVFSDIGLTANR